jgi:hypothetical protein
MARIRCIKPEFWTAEQIAECSTNARLTFIGLWNFCDDQGVHPAKPKTLKAELFPMDDFPAATVAEWVGELIKVGLLDSFVHEGETYWYVTGWAKHQRIDRPSCKHPAPPAKNSTSRPPPRAEQSQSARRTPPPGMEGNGKERKGVDSAAPKARAIPTPAKNGKTPIPADFAITERVKAWALQHGHTELGRHLEAFKAKCAAHGYGYVDHDAAFMEAIRCDWAKLRQAGPVGRTVPVLTTDHVFGAAA